jgi:hypothetical protein
VSWQSSRPEDTSYKSIGCSAVPEKSSEMYLNTSQGLVRSAGHQHMRNLQLGSCELAGAPAADEYPFKWILWVPLCSKRREVPAGTSQQQCSSRLGGTQDDIDVWEKD